MYGLAPLAQKGWNSPAHPQTEQKHQTMPEDDDQQQLHALEEAVPDDRDHYDKKRVEPWTQTVNKKEQTHQSK